MKQKSLNRILQYKNPEVVARFSKSLGIPTKTSELIFKDLLRFLWLSQNAKIENSKKPGSAPNVVLMNGILILDEMWHIFILYTAEYTQFSERYFGAYLHHGPSRVLKKKTKSKPKAAAQKNYDDLLETSLIKYVFSELGEDVAVRWFLKFPQEYSVREIRRRQLKHHKAVYSL